ncbi:uncharacterized protein LOC128210931 [Mya arenaria]|uniref:uncharacterized protein LOC128210931 n=1 Tax=Mya arenaria TaxID=6604 RepID=UPI0022E449F4|nr:uncharacterized protein LOC128210931 [Mya arenaria]
MASKVLYERENGTTNFLRCVQLLIDVGRRVYRRLLGHYVIQETGSKDLSAFLRTHKSTLESLSRRKFLHQCQFDLLFPSNKAATDCKGWDLTLLGLVLNNCASLSQNEEQALSVLRQSRNSAIGHCTSASLSDAKFQSLWGSIVNALETLVKVVNDQRFTADVEQKTKNILNSVPENARLDLEEARKKLQFTIVQDLHVEIDINLTHTKSSTHVAAENANKVTEETITLQTTQDFLLKRYEHITEMHVLSCVQSSVNVGGIYVDSTICNAKQRYGFFPNAEKHAERVTSYQQFFDGENPKNVYLIGSSGRGKTTFCLQMIHRWCKGTLLRQEGAPMDENETYLCETFDVILLVYLANALRGNSVIDMIKDQLFVENQRHYDFVMKHLSQHPRRVLLILDGYDEWQGSDDGKLPSREHLNNCVTLMTLHHSKVGSLPIKHSDQLYELQELDERSVRKLVEKIARSVCGDDQGRRVNACLQALKQRHLTLVTEIPLVLTYLVCFWYDTGGFGDSRTDIYFQLLQFLLNKSTKINQTRRSDDRHQTKLPKLIEKYNICRYFEEFLLSLGRFAFDCLLNEHSPTTFTRLSLESLLGKDKIDLGLSTGLLALSPMPSAQSPGRVDVRFFHNTVRDYLAAVYVASDPDHSKPIKKLLAYVDTFEKVLDMSDVMIFLCGLMPQDGEQISTHIAALSSTSRPIQTYRNSLDERYVFGRRQQLSTYKYAKLIQKLQLRCYRETERNRKYSSSKPVVVKSVGGVLFTTPGRKLRFTLNDVLVVDQVSDVILDVISCQNVDDLKSIYVDVPGKEDTSLVRLVIAKCTVVERLHLDEASSHVILTMNAVQLKLLTSLTLVLKDIPALPSSFCALTSLCYLSLEVSGSHQMVKDLQALLLSRTQLIELELEKVRCMDHQKALEECDFSLNLTKQTRLRRIYLNDVNSECTTLPLSVNDVNVSGLVRNVSSVFRSFDKPTATVTELGVGHAGTFLWTQFDYRTLFETLPNMHYLCYVSIVGVKYYDLALSSRAKDLKEVFLHDVMMYEHGWLSFLTSLSNGTSTSDVEILNSNVYSKHGGSQPLTSNRAVEEFIRSHFINVVVTPTSFKFQTRV